MPQKSHKHPDLLNAAKIRNIPKAANKKPVSDTNITIIIVVSEFIAIKISVCLCIGADFGICQVIWQNKVF